MIGSNDMKWNVCLTVGIALAAVVARASVVNVHVVDAQSEENLLHSSQSLSKESFP